MNTIEVKTSELEGAALDWAVAKADGWDFSKEFYRIMVQGYCPSTDWSQGGPLIDKRKVSIVYHNTPDRTPLAVVDDMHPEFESGETVLIAACRAIVAAELGDTVQVPADLMEGAA